MNQEVEDWKEKLEYLPTFMRDFHDSKNLFKTIQDNIIIEEGHPAKKISFVEAHCYTIDVFLWFMANHGYTLQKTKKRLEFADIQETLKYFENQRKEKSSQVLKNILEDKS